VVVFKLHVLYTLCILHIVPKELKADSFSSNLTTFNSLDVNNEKFKNKTRRKKEKKFKYPYVTVSYANPNPKPKTRRTKS